MMKGKLFGGKVSIQLLSLIVDLVRRLQEIIER